MYSLCRWPGGFAARRLQRVCFNFMSVPALLMIEDIYLLLTNLYYC